MFFSSEVTVARVLYLFIARSPPLIDVNTFHTPNHLPPRQAQHKLDMENAASRAENAESQMKTLEEALSQARGHVEAGDSNNESLEEALSQSRREAEAAQSNTETLEEALAQANARAEDAESNMETLKEEAAQARGRAEAAEIAAGGGAEEMELRVAEAREENRALEERLARQVIERLSSSSSSLLLSSS